MTTTATPSASPITPRFVIATTAATIAFTLAVMALALVIAGPRQSSESQPHWAVVIHLATVLPAFFLGIVVMTMKKGTPLHRMLGRIWGVLMMVTAIDSFCLQGLFGGIGPIHIFSVMTLISIPRGIIAIRRGNMKVHERAMTGPFIGLCVAGAFSLIPGRIMGNVLLTLF